ncbi:MAG: carbohydrate ABC transporter permease [Coriobacteriales bacterium]|jgi:ABC transporter, permease protein
MKNFSKVKLKKYGFVWTIMAYPMLLFIVFYLVCNFGSLVMAFQKRDFLGNVTGWVGFANFTKFVKDIAETELMSTALKNTCLMYGTDLLIVLPLQLLFSYYLFRKIPGHKAIRFIVMLPSIISGFVVCLVFKKFVEGALPSMMKNLFGLKTFPNLISEVKYTFKTVLFYNVWMSFTTALVMYSNAMNQVSDEILESGKIDGVEGGLQEMFYLVLPMIFPTITTFLITGFSAFLSMSGPLVAFFKFNAPQSSYTLGYFFYIQVAGSSSQIMYPYLAAGGLIMTIIMAPLTFLLKYVLEKYGPSTEY